MPVQHADDAILKSMRRAVTARRMREIVAQFRAAIPGVTVRTTVLVGFPGETEEAFERLLQFVDEVRFDRLGVFTYSPEDGTPSPDFPGQVDAEVAAERAARVQEAQDAIAWERAAKLVGTEAEVLVDGPSEDGAFAWEGRTAGQAPEIDGLVYLRGGRLHGRPLRPRARRRGRRLRAGRRARLASPSALAWRSSSPRWAASAGRRWRRARWPARSPRCCSGSCSSRRSPSPRCWSRSPCWAPGPPARRSARIGGGKDPGAIVIDEVAGMVLAVLAVPPTLLIVVIAFLLFRLFDVVKPFPANVSQRLRGGIGVMIDDLIAGLYALVLLAGGPVGWDGSDPGRTPGGDRLPAGRRRRRRGGGGGGPGRRRRGGSRAARSSTRTRPPSSARWRRRRR